MRRLLNFYILKSLNFNTNSIYRSGNYSRQISLFAETNNQIFSALFVTKRNASNVYVPPPPVALTRTAVGKDESRDFMAVFPDIVRDLTEAGKHLDIPDVTKWFTKVLQYNVPGGKKNRGLALVTAYRIFCPPNELTSENLQLARIMGWCVELLQAFFLVVDDVMDEAETRRGRLCWYRVEGNDKIAVNDSILLHCGIYVILKKYFADKPYYVQILELFHDITMKTSMGQSLDMLMSGNYKKTRKLDKFTMDRYKAIVKYKTAYYSFQLPIASAMYMSGILDHEKHRQVKHVLLEMGDYFQIQDDYLDCFGDPESIGKVGTDIQDGKCTWLLVVALQRATPQQKALLEDCYGIQNPEKVQKVKQIYKDIGIPSIYSIYEEDTYKLLVDRIQQLSRGLPHEVFFKILDKIYRRRS